MDANLLTQSTDLVRKAVAADEAGDVSRAKELYLLALEGLVRCHAYEKLPANRAILKHRIETYMTRVETLKAALDPSPSLTLPSSPSDPPVVLPNVPLQSPSPTAPIFSSPPSAPRTIRLAGETGWDLEKIFAPYARGAARVTLEDPHLSLPHQLRNLVRFCEMLCVINDCHEFLLITRDKDPEFEAGLLELQKSMAHLGRTFSWQYSASLHDRCVRFSNGWKLVLGRGLDMWEKPASAGSSKYYVGSFDLRLRTTRPCEIIALPDQ